MTNKARYEELEIEIEYAKKRMHPINLKSYSDLLEERIQTDWENNKEQLEFLNNLKQGSVYINETFKRELSKISKRIIFLEKDKKFIQELANKYGVEL